MKITLLRSFLMLGAFLCFGLVKAQTVSGTVSDANGPLPGASVLVKGTTNGTQTDFDGNYTLNGVEDTATLVFSYIGYKTQEIAVNGQSNINVTLSEDAQALDEVVIIGYGQTTVKDATGAVSAVTSEDFNQGVISSPEQLIQGKTSGVQITQSSGEPGAGIALRIRGTASVRSNNSPLFVIDGVPVTNESVSASGADVGVGSSGARNPLNFLNPNDIESMSILKDASATAIYGSRGANGVVVITTKSGKGGGRQGQWAFSTTLNVSKVADTYDLLNSDEFVERGGSDLGGSTDWQSYIFRTTASTDNNLSYSQNYGQGNVRATFGYSKQFGVIENTDLERITGRVNAAHRFFDDKFKVNLQTTVSRINDQAPFISRTSGSTGDLLASAYYANPTLPANPDISAAPDRNPANLLAYYDDNTHTDRFLGNLSLEYDITDEFSAKLNLGYDTSSSTRGQVSGPQILALNNGAENNGRAAVSNLDTENRLLEFTVNYNKEFENSNLDALIGFSFQDFNRKGQNLLGQGYISQDLNTIIATTNDAYASTKNLASNYQAYGIGTFQNNPDAGNQFRILGLTPNVNETTLSLPSIPIDAFTVDTFDNTDELQSFFGRINYTLYNKYLFTATVRADGSSRFGGNNQYGYFPSAAFAWKLNEEDFTGDTFSTLKMRLSWGITGNQDGLGYGSFVNRTRWNQLGIGANSQITPPATSEIAFANPDLKWEETAQYAFGIDFGFNNDRFTGNIDLYRKETSDILLNLPAVQPATSPFVFQNVDGVIINQGIELGLDYDIVRSEDFTWNANFNISYNQNELTDYDGPDIQAGNLYGQGLTGTTSQILTDGKPLFTYNLRLVDEDFNVDTDPTILDKSGLPKIISGFSTSASYKNWDASLFFSGQFGHYVYNNTANALFAAPQIGSRNNLKSVVDNGVTLSATNPSTYFLEKGDFVRLQSASISYNVPLSGDGTFNSMRLSLNGQNLFLITDYSGLDPEVSTTDVPANGLPSASIDYLQYPRPRTFSLGINVTF
ncbi:SusC/RagA family TonB-linked outer membrane protein [Muricauda oceani]|uniref:SusC/RagA family TonB-linked outer membrane protein n=1 Tax=Flagellimonas oceani TaxID=2698672 RepID=A0A6G7J666_9FLAO|nr:SusC/RagA family TonB-linked outer membrane protein [Allomuricauda oceani]MBW8242198.1 SusC/RagA family TonB-linked outer membrane protein [Allomuricauda oceani]QII45962.1 SusC/RagA family TonB-linked outer membrane protein [Allomuricauda oceani]